jgi:GNAT superfamily N-acetyltransferase
MQDLRTVIRKANPSDRATVIETLTVAFARDPIIRFQFQDDETYPARAAAFFGHYFDVRIRGGEIFVAGNGTGVSLWNPPGGNRLGKEFVESDWERNVVPALDAAELRRYESFKVVLDAMTPREPHWYLGLLATRPEKQRTGVGRGLLEPMLQRADDDHVAVFLETANPDNVEIYKRFGFDVSADEVVPGGPRVWGMLRLPSKP